MQRDFISNVSHELKTPIASLALASDALEERSKDEREKKYVHIIQKEVGRLKKNVEDILHASLVESHLKTPKEELELMGFFQTLLDSLREEYSVHMVEWELDCPAISVQTNQKMLENILRNLVDNAVKYGGKKISIEVLGSSKEVAISISDNGIGIAPEHQKKVFSKFYRVPDTDHQHNQKGFGLGLHIVASQVKKLGGKISLSSNLGQGSTFKITFPNG